jgi:hypothetical protein
MTGGGLEVVGSHSQSTDATKRGNMYQAALVRVATDVTDKHD